MRIEFYRKNVYGQELMYVADQVQQVLLAQIVGTKTISMGQMGLITDMFGVKWAEVLAPKSA